MASHGVTKGDEVGAQALIGGTLLEESLPSVKAIKTRSGKSLRSKTLMASPIASPKAFAFRPCSAGLRRAMRDKGRYPP